MARTDGRADLNPLHRRAKTATSRVGPVIALASAWLQLPCESCEGGRVKAKRRRLTDAYVAVAKSGQVFGGRPVKLRGRPQSMPSRRASLAVGKAAVKLIP